MLFDVLTDHNVDMYALKAYDNIHCENIDEFYDDMKRIKYIKRLFNRYTQTGELKDRLILNHIIVLYNVFPVEAASRILFFKIDVNDYSKLKTFLVFLGYMPEVVKGVRGRDILNSDISLDVSIISKLRNI
tara:strand:+ start:110 stop:502 length:393 start_codon:yes stop_codon:yes gene_type:complete